MDLPILNKNILSEREFATGLSACCKTTPFKRRRRSWYSFHRGNIVSEGMRTMPEKKTVQRARRAKSQGKKPSTQAGEFVREEIKHVRKGKHGARSTKQAIAIGLSKARRAGVNLPKKGKAAKKSTSGQTGRKRKPSAKRSEATTRALKREGRQAASHRALSRQAKQTARRKKAVGA